MKRIATVICLSIICLSCSVKTVPLKSTYLEGPSIIVSPNDKDVVWDKLIDFFAQKGLSIKIIDRSSGLITSEETRLTWSYENDKGRLNNPEAWVAIPVQYRSGVSIDPESVVGEWNVRIKSTEDNKTSINVNMVNIKRSDEFKNAINIKSTEGKSTGKFEELIASFIK